MWLRKLLPNWIVEESAPGWVWIYLFVLSIVTMFGSVAMSSGYLLHEPITGRTLVAFGVWLCAIYFIYCYAFFAIRKIV